MRGPKSERCGRVLGVDLGTRRIGLAVSDISGTLARPWRVVEGGPLERAVATLVDIVRALLREDDGLSQVVVGLPRKLDGTPHAMTQRVRAIVERLRAELDVPVAVQDERLSSHEAESRLAFRERDWRKRKARLDAAAAAVILQDYLDERRQQSEAVDC